MFNALEYTKSLEAVGIPREQAEAQVQLVIAAIEDEVATKTDLSELRNEMKSQFADVRAEITDFKAEVKAEFADVRAEFADFKAEVKAEFADVRAEFADFKAEVKAEFSDVRAEFPKLRSEISEMKSDLVFKLGALFVGFNSVGFGLLGIVIAIVSRHS